MNMKNIKKATLIISVFFMLILRASLSAETDMDFFFDNYWKCQFDFDGRGVRRYEPIENQIAPVLGRKVSRDEYLEWKERNPKIYEMHGKWLSPYYDIRALDISIKYYLLLAIPKAKTNLELRERDMLWARLLGDIFDGEVLQPASFKNLMKSIREEIDRYDEIGDSKNWIRSCEGSRYYAARYNFLLPKSISLRYAFAHLLGQVYYDDPERVVELFEASRISECFWQKDALEFIEFFKLDGKITPEFRAKYAEIMARRERERAERERAAEKASEQTGANSESGSSPESAPCAETVDRRRAFGATGSVALVLAAGTGIYLWRRRRGKKKA